jgi:c-di-GMP-related signal transduction protein
MEKPMSYQASSRSTTCWTAWAFDDRPAAPLHFYRFENLSSMNDFIVRNPLLDPKQHILGYELVWQNRQRRSAHAACEAMLALIVEQFGNEVDLPSGSTFFVDVAPALLDSMAVRALVPQNFALGLKLAELADPGTLAAVKALREQGFGILLRDAEAIVQDKSLLPVASHLEIRFAGTDVATQAKIYGAVKVTPVRVVASDLKQWKDFDAYAALGIASFAGNLLRQPPQTGKTKGINPAQALILQLMDMVRKNADVRQIETALKRDAALSYKLLRYINSSGFGLGTEIQSLRHAVSLLGYSPLYRWLSVLLATASDNAQSQALMQTAIIRGRFAEMLGQGLLPKSEAENLFVAGMFSLLDRLLGMPMEEVLESVQLPAPVEEALLSRGGMYGPFLALAEACESEEERIGQLADSLFISAPQVNEAHLAALRWTLALKL